MLFPGDTANLVLSITLASGAAPNVTVVPIVSVLRLVDQVVVVNAQTMTLLPGTQAVYVYSWATAGALNGDYVAIVSYASDGISVSGRYLESITLGNSMILGPVALSSTVALDATVAKDATVAHVSDLVTISPDTSPAVLAIKAKTDNLPADPATLSVVNTIAQNVQDLHDYNQGTWTIDKTVSPQVLTILRANGGVLCTFQLTDSTLATHRTPSF